MQLVGIQIYNLNIARIKNNTKKWNVGYCLMRFLTMLSIFGAFEKLQILASPCLSVRLSARMQQLNSQKIYFYEILYLSIFRKYVQIIQFFLNLKRIMGTSPEVQYTYLIMSRSFLSKTRNVPGKLEEKISTHILWSINLYENDTVYEKIQKNSEQPTRLQVTTWHCACALHAW